jgi:hypothetical protein
VTQPENLYLSAVPAFYQREIFLEFPRENVSLAAHFTTEYEE